MATSALRSSSSAAGTSSSRSAMQMPTLARGKTSLPSISRWRSSAREDAPGDVGGLLRVDDAVEQDGELVAAEAGDGVGRPHGRLEPGGDLLQHEVAGGVTEAVVDRLEVVEVDEDDARPTGRRAPCASARAGRGRRRARGWRGSVTGSWNAWCASWSSNAFCSLTSRLLRTMPRTCSSWSRFVCCTSNCSQVPSRCRSEHSIACVSGAASGRPGQDAREPRAIGVAQQPVEARALDLVGRVAEQALDRGALVGDGAVGGEHGDQVARVGDERAEARLALAAVEILGERRRPRPPARPASPAPRASRATRAPSAPARRRRARRASRRARTAAGTARCPCRRAAGRGARPGGGRRSRSCCVAVARARRASRASRPRAASRGPRSRR